MTALLLTVLLDLATTTPSTATRDGLALKLSVDDEPNEFGNDQVTVTGTLANTTKKPLRVVWDVSGEQPLTLFVDGKEHKLPPGPAKAALQGWTDLAPGESRTASLTISLPPGHHQLRWQYTVERGPYGHPLERCWTGRLSTEAAVTTPLRP